MAKKSELSRRADDVKAAMNDLIAAVTQGVLPGAKKRKAGRAKVVKAAKKARKAAKKAVRKVRKKARKARR